MLRTFPTGYQKLKWGDSRKPNLLSKGALGMTDCMDIHVIKYIFMEGTSSMSSIRGRMTSARGKKRAIRGAYAALGLLERTAH